MRYILQIAIFALSLLFLQGASKVDYLIDGVPLPADVLPLESGPSDFAGVWVGAWDGVLKHILVVESIAGDGSAKVVYAVADHPQGRFRKAWKRRDARIADTSLTISGENASVTYRLSTTGRLAATFGNDSGFAIMTRLKLSELTRKGANIAWSAGEHLMLATDLVENGKPVGLETVLYRPAGNGPFPLAVINHGSTGYGNDARLFANTWVNPWLADFLNERGWMVAFPQRRGRGKSDGLYDEGFAEDRSKGYTCNPERTLYGATRALEDIDSALTALRRRPDISNAPVLLSGNSRGGILSAAYAGLHPDEVHGVINFVGGWIGEGCHSARTVNQTLFRMGAAFPKPMLWLYGRNDLYYSIDHSRENLDSFRNAGGTAHFIEVTVAGKNNGHHVAAIPPLWTDDATDYLDMISAQTSK